VSLRTGLPPLRSTTTMAGVLTIAETQTPEPAETGMGLDTSSICSAWNDDPDCPADAPLVALLIPAQASHPP
jgi:hypothetical protein